MIRLLKSVLSPMSAMRIDSQSQPAAGLERKLHLITQYLINSPKQFDAWMELQNSIHLHFCLHEIFAKADIKPTSAHQPQAETHSAQMGVGEQELASIIQFYTMLIINSNDELLVCKLVSDDFVVQMCRLDRLHPLFIADLEAYRINLIRAYLSKITPEVVKYMVIQDKFKVFQICVQLFSGRLGTGSVQFTTLSNTILNVLGKVDSIPYLWENLWATQGLQLLLTEAFQYALKQFAPENSQNCALLHSFQTTGSDKMEKMRRVQADRGQSECMEMDEKQICKMKKEENAENTTNQEPTSTSEKNQESQSRLGLAVGKTSQLNCLEIGTNSISHLEDEQEKVGGENSTTKQREQAQLPRLSKNEERANKEILEEIVLFLIEVRSSMNGTQIGEQIEAYCYLYVEELSQQIWMRKSPESIAELFSTLFVLLKTYKLEREVVEKAMQEHFEQILVELVKLSACSSAGKNQEVCKLVFMVNKLVTSKFSYMSERNVQHSGLSKEQCAKLTQARNRTLQALITVIGNSMQFYECSPALFLQFCKYLLLTVFSLKMAMNPTCEPQQHNEDIFQRLDEAMLELFLSYTVQLKKLMAKSELWNDIIKWYEDANNKVTQNILTSPDILEQKPQDPFYSTLLTYEYLRNYRYMIVEHTSLDPKFIKQEKFYHLTFSSPGLAYQPGKIVNGSLPTVCHCLFHHNYQQIPVVIIEDRECLLIAMKISDNEYRILVNIKFKDVEGLVYGNSRATDGANNWELPRFVKINLRGSQQILLEFSNPKLVGNCFKDYLIKSRDSTRQRQLSFLHQWIKDYQMDSEKSLSKVKQGLKKQDYIVL